MREGCVTAALTWVVISVMGAVPFVLSGAIPDPIEALFETVSGFTTTGASVLADVESLPMGILFWRSFTHWIGGMGILVFLLAVLPMTGGSHVNLMKAESPGPQVEKMVPSVRQTARVRVDEEGMEAAAVVIAASSEEAPQETEPCVMNLNRPFLFVLRCQGMPLLVGIVNNV